MFQCFYGMTRRLSGETAVHPRESRSFWGAIQTPIKPSIKVDIHSKDYAMFRNMQPIVPEHRPQELHKVEEFYFVNNYG